MWRHQGAEQTFEMSVVFETEGAAKGSVLCTVHADNLTRPKPLRVSVRRIVEEVSLVDEARRMVEACG